MDDGTETRAVECVDDPVVAVNTFNLRKSSPYPAYPGAGHVYIPNWSKP